MESTSQTELLNQHINAFESIKSLPEENGSTRYNLLIAARNYFESFLEKSYPERVSELTELKLSSEDANASNETVDSYINIIKQIQDNMSKE